MCAQGSAPSSRGRSRLTVWLIEWAGLTYVIAFFLTLAVFGFVPPGSWSRGFRVLGLSLNAAGAVIALSPRVFRVTGQNDALLARWGLTLLALGFIEQVLGAIWFG